MNYAITANFKNNCRMTGEVKAVSETHAYEIFLEIPDVKNMIEKYPIVQYTIEQIEQSEPVKNDGQIQLCQSPGSDDCILVDFNKMLVCSFTKGRFIQTHKVVPMDDSRFDESDSMATTRAVARFAEYLDLYHPDVLDMD